MKKKNVVRVIGDIEFVHSIDEFSGYHVATCDKLQLTCSEEYFYLLVESINELLQDLFLDIAQDGTLYEWLNKRDLKLQSDDGDPYEQCMHCMFFDAKWSIK